MKSDLFPKGAEWRKWDLHIHTPASLVQHFDGATIDEKWEKFILDLEALPPEFQVIGINDYLFIDGYRKVLEYRKAGRLKNITTILPVVEFRVKKFAGHKEWKRVNFHVIFSDEVSPDIIQTQFLNTLDAKYKVSPGHSGVTWQGVITRNSLEDLGQAIKKSLPQEELKSYGSDLEEGFNNLNLEEQDIMAQLESNTYLKNNYLTAVGKTEWESLSWNDQSIAEKKDIINSVDFVFISSETVDACINAKKKLKSQFVNHLLLDCSDAHFSMTKSSEKDRIGKCFTWIKGDPTFEGLKQIRYEPETRVILSDDKPDEKISYNVIDKVKFIGATNPPIFSDQVIELNPSLNVIIGGKSSGKSLLLYHIAKAIDPRQVSEKMGVVGEKEYDLKKNMPGFDFAVLWKDGYINRINEGEEMKTRQITYIPQMYINHLAEQKGERKLAELIDSILHQNEVFKKFYDQQAKSILELNLKIGLVINELFAVRNSYSIGIKELREIGDKTAILANIQRVKKEIGELNAKAGFTEDEMVKYSKLINRRNRVGAARERVTGYGSYIRNYVEHLNIGRNLFLSSLTIKLEEWNDSDDNTGKFFAEINIKEDQKKVSEIIDGIIEKYNLLEAKVKEALVTKVETLASIETDLLPFTAKISNQTLMGKLAKEMEEDETKIRLIEEKEKYLASIKEAGAKIKATLLSSVSSLFNIYQTIVVEIQKPYLSEIGKDLKLSTALEIDLASFQSSFGNMLDGRSNFNFIFGNSFDASNNYVYTEAGHLANLTTLFDKLWSADVSQIKFKSGFTPQDAIQQLFKDFYKIKYNIIYGTDDILQMSPGKRGLVLLQIILHLSNAKHPILIDQPEDNLDNRTIFKDLNNFIKDKKQVRQILLVTHNANLVVSTDAEEVIVANQSGQDTGKINTKFQFEYITGSLENTYKDSAGIGILSQMGIREHVCDILEGGEEAFIYREKKYGFI